MPPLVGYLLAGIVVGPFPPGFVADTGLALQLADIGVILLMFGVGLQFHVGDLLAVKAVVVPGAILQMLLVAELGAGAGILFGWPAREDLVFGLCLSIASTVVVMRALSDRRLMETHRGRVAIGWLVVQDLLTVIVLVVLPPLAVILKGGAIDLTNLGTSLAFTAGKLALFAALLFFIGRRIIPAILHYIAHTGSRELFRLAVLSVALIASELFDVSLALGAFFAGMILAGSPLSQRAAEESLPLRDAFAVLFFVSVGMLFNPRVVVEHPMDLAISFLTVVAGGFLTYLLLRTFGVKRAAAFTIAISLAQIGEFSFILADLGIGLGILRGMARDLILGVSILSILLNPILFALAAYRERSRAIAPTPDLPSSKPQLTALREHAILVGYGRVGQIVAEGLKGTIPLLIVEEGAVGDPSFEHIRGNAAREDVLVATNLSEARLLFVAIPQAFEAGQIVEQARKANPTLAIIARSHFDAETEYLMRLGVTKVIMGEREIATAMLDFSKAVETRWS